LNKIVIVIRSFHCVVLVWIFLGWIFLDLPKCSGFKYSIWWFFWLLRRLCRCIWSYIGFLL